jgi:hypothetical protein
LICIEVPHPLGFAGAHDAGACLALMHSAIETVADTLRKFQVFR